jgi:hypothetical protein
MPAQESISERQGIFAGIGSASQALPEALDSDVCRTAVAYFVCTLDRVFTLFSCHLASDQRSLYRTTQPPLRLYTSSIGYIPLALKMMIVLNY